MLIDFRSFNGEIVHGTHLKSSSNESSRHYPSTDLQERSLHQNIFFRRIKIVHSKTSERFPLLSTQGKLFPFTFVSVLNKFLLSEMPISQWQVKSHPVFLSIDCHCQGFQWCNYWRSLIRWHVVDYFISLSGEACTVYLSDDA